jgi:hypothetical protein
MCYVALAFDSAGNLYAANFGNNTIEKFTSGGVGTVFASTGLNGPGFPAFTDDNGVPLLLPPAPEPTTLALAAIGSLALLGRNTRRRRN